MDLTMFEDDAIVSEWALSTAGQGERASLPMNVGDWGLANEIRAEIFLPEGVDDQIRCTLTSGHRTEGMSQDDGYWFNAIVSPRGGNIWRGWQRVPVPRGVFLYRRNPDGGVGRYVLGRNPRSARKPRPEYPPRPAPHRHGAANDGRRPHRRH